VFRLRAICFSLLSLLAKEFLFTPIQTCFGAHPASYIILMAAYRITWLIHYVFICSLKVRVKPIHCFLGMNLLSVYIFTWLPFRSEINRYRNNYVHINFWKCLAKLSKQIWIKDFPVILGTQFWSSTPPYVSQPLSEYSADGRLLSVV